MASADLNALNLKIKEMEEQANSGRLWDIHKNLLKKQLGQMYALRDAASPPQMDPNTAEAQSAMNTAEMEQRRRRGRVNTMLTGGQGVMGVASTLRKTLMGS